MSDWVGYAISVNCAEPLGCYQGTIVKANTTTITLTKAFRNGFPYPKSQVTLNAADIKDMKILESRPEPSEQTHSTVAVTKSSKKSQRATVCETLQANPTSSAGNQAASAAVCSKGNGAGRGASGPARSKPIDIQGARGARPGPHEPPAARVPHGSYGSTPKGRVGHDKARRRNEACFGDCADPALLDDFDFEGNLALFNKRELWEQIRNSAKPDVVRHADDAGKFRHDENVLGGAQAPRRAVRVPPELGAAGDYVTDEGLVVGSAGAGLRARLWAGLRERGLAGVAHTLLARAAADVALRLVGGGRRLDPRNAHQAPTAVALAGAHGTGAAGLTALRLLASHGVRATALLAAPLPPAPDPELARELAALAPAGVALARSADELPSADLVLLALHDPEVGDAGEDGSAEARGALRWAGGARGCVVALEPPAAGWAGVGVRAAVQGVVPGAPGSAHPRLYLADVAPPPQLFAELGVHYRAPFGASSVLPLYPADD